MKRTTASMGGALLVAAIVFGDATEKTAIANAAKRYCVGATSMPKPAKWVA